MRPTPQSPSLGPSPVALRAWLETVDAPLARATEGLAPLEAVRPREPYVALLRAIVGQQLSTKAAASIWQRVHSHFDGDPSPERVIGAPVEALRGLGLSYRKAEYVGHVARYAQTGALRRDRLDGLSDEAIIHELTAIKGVGRWTVEMILMFVLGRPDVFPVDDLGIQGAMVQIYGLEGSGRALRAQMVPLSERWRPHRTYVSRLLWAHRNAQAR